MGQGTATASAFHDIAAIVFEPNEVPAIVDHATLRGAAPFHVVPRRHWRRIAAAWIGK